MADFYVKRDDHQFGPYNSSRLKQHADDGRVLSSDLVRQGEDGKWYPASSVKGLFPNEPVRQSPDAQNATSELGPEAEDDAMALLMHIQNAENDNQSTDVSVTPPSAATAQNTSPVSTPTEAPQPADTNPNLRACPDCDRMVSKRAAACPSCGAPLEPLQSSEPSVNEQVVQPVLDQPVGEESVNLNRGADDYAQQEEKVYFSENWKGEGQVQVTSSRVILPTQVYPLSNIASVRWGNDNRGRFLPLFMTIVGFGAFAGCLIAWILSGVTSNWGDAPSSVKEWADPETIEEYRRGAAKNMYLVSFVLFPIGGAAFWVGRSGYKSLQKAKSFFYLFVGTAGGETPQLGGTDRRFFQQLVASINQAIVDRGGH